MKTSSERPMGIGSTTPDGSAATAGNGKEKGKRMKKIESHAKRFMWGLALLLPILIAGCGGHWNGTTMNGLVLSPFSQAIPKAAVTQFTATGINSDGTSTDVSRSAVWSSSDTSIAIVDANGLATGVAVGTTTIKGTYAGMVSTAQLAVTPALLRSVAVVPTAVGVARGLSSQFTALGIYSDGTSQDLTSQVTWASGNAGIAVFNANGLATSGLATGVNIGSALVSASFGGQTGSATLTVSAAVLNSITVTPATPSIVKNQSSQFTALGIYSDGTSQLLTSSAIWASGDSSVASLNANGLATSGLATGVGVGPSLITASFGGKTGSANLAVVAAALNTITVTQAAPSIVKGQTSQFTAMGTFNDGTSADITASAIWSSGNTAVAIMNPNGLASSGLASGAGAGSALISANFGGKAGSATLTVTAASLNAITVTPSVASIVKGQTGRFTAMGTFSDGSSADLTASVTWSSSDITVATLNANGLATSGLATGVNAGPALISASLAGKTGSAALTVTAATLRSINVTPASMNLVKGLSGQFTATGIFSDGSSSNLTASAVWASGNTNVATMNANGSPASGLATGVNAGSSAITASFGGQTGNATLNVSAASLNSIIIAPAAPSILKGATNQFIALGTFNDGTSADLTALVTWASLDATVATLNPSFQGNSGLATGVNAGVAGITASLSGKTGNATLNVTVAGQAQISLGAAARFGSFGGTAGLTNKGNQTVITGSNGATADIGTIATGTSSITGFHDSAPSDFYTDTLGTDSGNVTGKIYSCTTSTTGPTSAAVNAVSCANATQSLLAAQNAYNFLVAMPIGPNPDQGAGSLANLVLAPGVYKAAGGSFKIQGGDLTLDAQGDINAVWVFQMATSLTVGGPGAAFPQSVKLINGGQSKNVFWQVGSFATVNAGGGGTMVGTIISQAGSSFSTAGNVTPVILNGRALSLGASVTMVNTVVTVPAP